MKHPLLSLLFERLFKMKKILLVTGAGRGIGAQIALLAAANGYRVGVNYLSNAVAANDVVQQIQAQGGEAVALQADVGHLDSVIQLFKTVDELWGPPNVLVNNAGLLANFRVEDVNEQNIEEVFRTNVYSAYFCSREAIRRMSTKHGGAGGVIVNISSVGSRVGGFPGGTAYAASKGATDSFNLAMAKEVGLEGIRVNAIRPGLIRTTMHENQGGLTYIEGIAKNVVPMGRMGLPEEVAQVALWLASDAASYVHGTTIDVAGGR